MPHTREQLLQIQASARVFQARADQAFEPWGLRAPAPTIGQDPNEYRRRLMIMAKNQLPDGHDLKKITVNRLPDDTINQFESLLFAACRDAGNRNDSAANGELRQVTRVNPDNGFKETVFLGTRHFVEDFKAPVRYVTGFRTNDGFVTTSGAVRR